MLSDYFILGLDSDASESEIRNRYLELIKKYTPERSPRRFQDITESYERIKSKREAIKNRLFGAFKYSESESALLALGRSVNISRRRAGLLELLHEAGLRDDNEKR
ncbi:MAG: J domain-containing protein [Dissulfuribacterales bacterium]